MPGARQVWRMGTALALALVLAVAGRARADAPRRVLLHIVGSSLEEHLAIVRVTTELLQRLPVAVVLDRSDELLGSEPTAYVARCTIDLRNPAQAVLSIHDASRDRMLVRRVARTPGHEELAREELGHIMLAAVEALLAGVSVGVPREEAMKTLASFPPDAEQLAPAPSTPAQSQLEAAASEERVRAPRQALQWSAALLYEVALLGHEPGVAHGPAVAVTARPAWPLRLGALLSAQYRFPLEVEAEPIGMRSQAFALRALATIEHALGARATLRLGLGGGADITRLTPELASDGARTTDARTLALAVARALLALDLRVARAFSLWIVVAADLDLDRSQYVVIGDGGTERAVAEPWRARPALLLGAALP